MGTFQATGGAGGTAGRDSFTFRAQTPPEQPVTLEGQEKLHLQVDTRSHEKNIEIFLKTDAACQCGVYPLPNGQQGKIDLDQQHKMMVNTVVYGTLPPCNPSDALVATEISVNNLSTLRMASELCQQGYRPLVLDMASAYHAGGGVRNGHNSQEEILCR
jgi:hypothetical protein